MRFARLRSTLIMSCTNFVVQFSLFGSRSLSPGLGVTSTCWLERIQGARRALSNQTVPAVGSRDSPSRLTMQTPIGVTPNMVAVGNSFVPGTYSQTASQQHAVPMQRTCWRVRDGRGQAHTLWRDELDDVLARIGLTRASIDEAPPIRPGNDSLSASRMELWADALCQ